MAAATRIDTMTISMRRQATRYSTTMSIGNRLGVIGIFLLGGCTTIPGLDMGVDRKLVGAPAELGGFDLLKATPDIVRDMSSLSPPPPFESAYRPMAADDPSNGESLYEYRIGPGDILSIIVWGHPELTSPAGEYSDPEASGRLVGTDGTIFYPYVGYLTVADLTVQDVRSIIASELSRVIRDPQVDVRVVAYRSKYVRVLGEVSNPGLVPITDRPLNVIEAVTAAGGLTSTANRNFALLRRDGETFIVPAHPDVDICMRHGDTITAPFGDNQSAFVLGAVNNQSAVFMPRGEMSLTEVLATVGGLDSTTANRRKVFLIRPNLPSKVQGTQDVAIDGPLILQFDFKDVSTLIMAEQFDVWPRDVVYVDRTGLASYNTIVSQILPTVTSLFQLERLVDAFDEN